MIVRNVKTLRPDFRKRAGENRYRRDHDISLLLSSDVFYHFYLKKYFLCEIFVENVETFQPDFRKTPC